MRGDNSPQPGQAGTVGGRSGPQRPGHRSGQAARGRERTSPRPAITQLLRILPEQPRGHRLPPLTPGHSGPSPLLSSSPFWARAPCTAVTPGVRSEPGHRPQGTPGGDPGLARAVCKLPQHCGGGPCMLSQWQRALHVSWLRNSRMKPYVKYLRGLRTSGITPCPRPNPPQGAC